MFRFFFVIFCEKIIAGKSGKSHEFHQELTSFHVAPEAGRAGPGQAGWLKFSQEYDDSFLTGTFHITIKRCPRCQCHIDEEIKLFEGALRRRQLRLILGGKMKAEDAAELKALFVKD